MKKSFILGVVALIAVPLFPKTAHIAGTVVNRPESKEVIIYESGSDPRINEILTIPLKDGLFSLDLPCDTIRRYEFVFDDEDRKGAWLLRRFFAEGDTLSLYVDGEERLVVGSSGENNRLVSRLEQEWQSEFGALNDSLSFLQDKLFESGMCLSEPLRSLRNEINKCSSDEQKDSLNFKFREMMDKMGDKAYTQQYRDIQSQLSELYNKKNCNKLMFVKNNISVFGLSEIKNGLITSGYNGMGEEWNSILEDVYIPSGMNHPYLEECKILADGWRVRPGNIYKDYTITSVDGTRVQIRDLVKGSPAVVNLWASWCSPCRRHSKELIPIFNKYKDKGFKVVAVAREKDNINKMSAAMEKDKYPWDSFVDLNDVDKVWRRNGCPNAGGRIILLSPQGVVLKVNPTTTEVEEYLKSLWPDID